MTVWTAQDAQPTERELARALEDERRFAARRERQLVELQFALEDMRIRLELAERDQDLIIALPPGYHVQQHGNVVGGGDVHWRHVGGSIRHRADASGTAPTWRRAVAACQEHAATHNALTGEPLA